jgi:peptidoglycan glycosyltransferase
MSLKVSQIQLPIFLALLIPGIAGMAFVLKKKSPTIAAFFEKRQVISRADLARALSLGGDATSRGSEYVQNGAGLPGVIEVQGRAGTQKREAIVQYSFDPDLQSEVETLFRQYLPDHGAFAAVDPESGRVLALVSHEKRGQASEDLPALGDHLALRATFPAASVFKVVTAAAAIAEKRFNADTRVAFNGSNHSLYRNNVLKDQHNRWTRSVSLRDAFGQSINTVFGKIGAFNLGAEKLRDYAAKFGFNRQIASDLPVQPGRASISVDADPWSLAEAASGFTRETTMSPLQGALIAASIVNGGKMIQPYAVQSVHLADGETIYEAESQEPVPTLSPQVASELMELMRQTVVAGTSRRSFRGFSRGTRQTVDVGGKTGSLTGFDPPGKYDWFVGFGKMGDKSIALAALTIHREHWRVKSSYVARRAIERYFLR